MTLSLRLCHFGEFIFRWGYGHTILTAESQTGDSSVQANFIDTDDAMRMLQPAFTCSNLTIETLQQNLKLP